MRSRVLVLLMIVTITLGLLAGCGGTAGTGTVPEPTKKLKSLLKRLRQQQLLSPQQYQTVKPGVNHSLLNQKSLRH